MAAKLEVHDVCPHLIPQDSTGRLYDGYITVKRKNFRFCISIPEQKCLKDARIECSWKLKLLLEDYEGVIKQRLAQSIDLASFLVELKDIMERLLQSQDEEQVISHPKYYTQLIEEIEAISWNKMVYVDPSFQVLKLLARDSRKRDHVISIHLSQQHPVTPPSCTTSLPGQFSFNWSTTQTSPLKGVYHQFEEALKNYEEFWDVMDEIDKNTWVLEPDQPSRSCTTRRIALGNNSSIHLEVNPLHPRLLPECRFLGADHVDRIDFGTKVLAFRTMCPPVQNIVSNGVVIIPMRENLNANLNLWNPKLSVLTNLENVLRLKFPSPSNTKKEDFSMECGICYAYRLNDAIPDKACDDSRCGQPFHQICLIEWLKSLPSSRQSFNMIFGECPYCSKPITVKMSAVR